MTIQVPTAIAGGRDATSGAQWARGITSPGSLPAATNAALPPRVQALGSLLNPHVVDAEALVPPQPTAAPLGNGAAAALPDLAQEIRALQERTMPALEGHVAQLHNIMAAAGGTPEGNSFYIHGTLQRWDALLPKQGNLLYAGSTAERRIMEVGFNGGHSAVLFLLGAASAGRAPNLTVFDLGEHRYMRPALDYVRRAFPGVAVEDVLGDSRLQMPLWLSRHPEAVTAYDLVHVDGGHWESCLFSDMAVAVACVRPGGLLVVDDTNMPTMAALVNAWVETGVFERLPGALETSGYQHAVLRRIKA
jgi:predicted O-methyltransferase YrrM